MHSTYSTYQSAASINARHLPTKSTVNAGSMSQAEHFRNVQPESLTSVHGISEMARDTM